MLITWDPDKAAANLDKHGVDFQDAATVFTVVFQRLFRVKITRKAKGAF